MLQNLIQVVWRGSRADQMPPWIGATRLTFAVAVAYFLSAELSISILAKSDGLAMLWLAGGVSSGVLIALGRDARLPVVCGTIVGTIVASLTGSRNIWISVTIALCNAGEALLAAGLIERYFGSPFSLDKLRNVRGLLVAAVVTNAAGAVGGTVAYKFLQDPTASIWATWQHWFASGSIGVITVTPLMIGLADVLRAPPRRSEIVEGVVALVGLVVMTVVIAAVPPEPWGPAAAVALLFPILLWLTARCQPVFAAAAAVTVSLTIVWTIALGLGHFGDPALPIGDRILGAQAAILGFTLCAYVLAALFAERRQHDARLQEALAAGSVMAFECDIRSGVAQRSENATQILGLDPQQPPTAPQFFAQIHPDDRAHFRAYHRRTRVDSPPTVTFRFLRPDGREVWLEETSRAERDSAGRPVRVKGVVRDITRRKQAEERQDLLIAELDHRVKNVLAVVAAVAMHTRRRSGTMDEFIKSLNGRIQAVAAAHALLSQSHWCGVGLTELVSNQLAPYTTDANISIGGPEVTLTAAQTQAVAMVMHELVTNAAKYGALSGPDGSVAVSWDCSADTILTIVWRERGGPPITAPVQSGYGSSLIRDLIPHELGGTVDLKLRPDGACCEIKVPLKEGLTLARPTPAALSRTIGDEHTLDISIRQFLKKLGVTAHREIERAVRAAGAKEDLNGATLPAKAVVTIGGIDLKLEIEGDIESGART
jgi:PAS domain S-box-containing protein